MYAGYSTKDWALLHKALKEILARPLDVAGICHAVRLTETGVLFSGSMLKTLFIQWPEYSGNMTYPIHTHKTRSAREEFCYCTNFWDKRTNYGRARYRLLRFCIGKAAEYAKPST